MIHFSFISELKEHMNHAYIVNKVNKNLQSSFITQE